MSARQIFKATDGRKNSEQQTSDIDLNKVNANVNADLYNTYDSNTYQSTSVMEEPNPKLRVEQINTNSGENLQKQLLSEQSQEAAYAYVMQKYNADPFDKVLLLKNIDNAILTSYRTLSKQNNQIS
jgi:hypothetical protein